MGDKTAIAWSDSTWNVATGCDRVSPGCDNCYAMTMAARLKLMGSAHYQLDGDPRTSGPGFGFQFHEDFLDQPIRWKRPRKIFTTSMSDLFHPEALKAMHTDRFGATYPFLAEVLAVMVRADWHIFQTLTKRPQIMASLLRHPNFKLDVNAILLRDGHPVMPGGMSESETLWAKHMWFGASIENDRYAFRADHVRHTPAAIRFLSIEPFLGPVPSLDLTDIDWVIVGAESGKGARPMDEGWVREVRDACLANGTAFFYKQAATKEGKKILDPLLDGVRWDQYPETAA